MPLKAEIYIKNPPPSRRIEKEKVTFPNFNFKPKFIFSPVDGNFLDELLID